VGECFFLYQPTWVVPDKGPLNGCMGVCASVTLPSLAKSYFSFVAAAVIVHSCISELFSLLYRSLDGYWSENGCEISSRYEKSQHRYVECRCTHFSTFAVLMDLSDEDVCKYDF